MPNILDLVTPVAATAFARQIPEPIENPLSSVLPNVNVQGITAKQVRRTHRSTIAKFRSFDAAAPIGKRPDGIITSDVSLLPLSWKLPIGEKMLLELAEGASDAAIGRIVEAIYDDIERTTVAILNRAEKARGQFLTTGKITLAENGVIDEADFLLPGDHVVAPGVLWSSVATATPLSDEKVWARKVRADSGQRPVAATTSERVQGYLLASAEYRNAFWQRGADSPTLNPEQLNQVRASNGLPPLNIYEGEVPTDAATGTVRVIEDDKFILTTATVGESQWGITAEARQLVGSNAVDFNQTQAPGITVVQYNDQDPVTTWTKASSIFLPVAGDINGLLVADVA